jgi:hypothetical protein
MAQAYIRVRQEYGRAAGEAAMVSLGTISGQNPAENETIIHNGLKKACISMITS